MLGWHISVYRQQTAASSSASLGSAQGLCVATWRTGLGGLDWLDTLVKQQKAICLGGDGYPTQYTAMAKYLQRHIGESADAEASFFADEWLLIEAWDES